MLLFLKEREVWIALSKPIRANFLVISGKMFERKISGNGFDEEQGEPSNYPVDKVCLYIM